MWDLSVLEFFGLRRNRGDSGT
ncbi:hypothetical protein M6B38_401180 [Iris pallida]|uniref:Uncharacterized protein n=1 Tax=Iris pallida TaxID=29817 RepID=A0AAX6FTL1_IRIPA|nr:hypothetical protein M6B38_401180 [Iris pallida]